ncbi:MAG: TIGR04076 family protein [Clostridiales bacterium]|nr:TIGR04076 family protein [Clostridiales bacterium]
MSRRPKITITVTDRRGRRGCHRGHHVGETFDFDEDRGKICPMAMHCAFPYIDILRYGGHIPGQPEGTAEFCCSDADTIMVFRAEIRKEEEAGCLSLEDDKT